VHDALDEPGLGRWGALAGPGAAAAAIFLHGRGRNPDDVLELAARIGLPALACVAPAAPQNTWYPDGFMAPLEKNQPHLENALGRVDALVRALMAVGHAPERIAFVGFSQGGCLACEYVFQNPRRWGALVAFTGGLIGAPGELRPPAGDLNGTPVLLATADPDAWVPVGRVRETAEAFRRMNARVDERIYPGLEHAVNDDEMAAARALLMPLSVSAASR
jgi:phospholipase/carboxylesterase